MQKTEQRAFAAVWTGLRGRPVIVANTVRRSCGEALDAAGSYWPGGWPVAVRAGWRIRPVVIRVEDENEGATTHDR